MITRFHGIDYHKSYSTMAVLNYKGEEIDFKLRHTDLKGYIQGLGSEDAVVMEAFRGAFYWAERIESRGAQCYIIDPHRFWIIKGFWNKPDKQDSGNMGKA